MRLRLSLLQSWSIIDTITSHCHDVPQAILPKGLVSLQPTNATPTTTSIPNLPLCKRVDTTKECECLVKMFCSQMTALELGLNNDALV